MHAEEVVLDVYRAGSAQRLVEDVEVGAHGGDGLLVGQPHHLVDDPMMRDAQAERETALADGLHGEGLLGQRHGVAGLDRHDGRPDFDTGRGGADDGGGGERIELIGNLRDPHGRQAGRFRPLCVGLESCHLGAVATSLRPHHQADSHAALLSELSVRASWLGRREPEVARR